MMNSDHHARSSPAVQVPPWNLPDDPTASMFFYFNPNGDNANCSSSPFDALTALHRNLPSNTNFVTDSDLPSDDCDIPVDAYSCDDFRMFEFKVRKCARGRSHVWTECPYSHPGEKARRRDPRKYDYSGTPCPEFRDGHCQNGDSCEYGHGVFECWLHPTRYRTQPCKDATHCRRRVCFFAHTPDQLRVLPDYSSDDMSPSRFGFDSYSPTSTLYYTPVSTPSDSPPLSRKGSIGANSVSELAASMRNLHFQIGKGRMRTSPPTWGHQNHHMGSGHFSPRTPSTLRPGFQSLPATPTRYLTRSGLGVFDLWDQTFEGDPIMERVESGKNLRARIYGKLSKESSLERIHLATPGPDVGWVSELVM